MKQIVLNIALVISLCMVGSKVYSYDFEAGGIFYNVISFDELTCEVAPYDYKGDIDIPQYCEYYGKKLKVIGIGNEAFSNCTALTSVQMPDSMEYIGKLAFANCGLKDLELPVSLKMLKEHALSECALNRVNIKSISSWCNIKKNSKPLNDQTQLFIGSKLCTSITIPEDVISIGAYTFYHINSLKEIRLQSKIDSIGNYAFSGCINLEPFSIPSSCTYIGYSAFSGCSRFENYDIYIPASVRSIKERAFNGIKLNSIILESSTESISLGESCIKCHTIIIRRPYFIHTSNEYSRLVIGREVDELTNTSYENRYSDSLKIVELEDGDNILNAPDASKYWTPYWGPAVTAYYPTFYKSMINRVYWGRNIKGHPFKGQENIEYLTIGNEVVDISGLGAQKLLSYLNIGTGIMNIPDFSYSSQLAIIVMHHKTPPVANGFAKDSYLNAFLYVPKGSKVLYQTADVWKNFFKIIEFEPDEEPNGVISPNINDLETPVYLSIDGTIRSQILRGINIIKMSDGTTKKVLVK